MLLFSATIFISAALLFLVPSFGGPPAVWTGSMMFFQATLLVGYLYVHATTTWLGARRQAILHLVVDLLPLLVLPPAVPGDEWAPSSQGNPIFLLLGLLAVSVGLPFFAISTTNPLVQRWLSDTDHPAARDPYFLYRASNLGSVIGLLGYPLVVEREFTLSNQGLWWSVGYGLLVVLVFASAVMLWRSEPAPAQEEEEAESLSGDPVSGGGSPLTADPSLEAPAGRLSGRPTWLRRARWVGLTFVPSSLMLGVTAFITTDITPIPLLWVIPLSLYLFSFVIVFSPSQRMPDAIHKGMVAVLPLVIAVLVVAMLIDLRDPFWLLIGLHLLGFFVVAMVLHGEVARDRPPARHLTEFYLWVSVGGVLGGVFNALVAPVAFDTVIEYPLMIIMACLFLPGLLLARLVAGERDRRRAASSAAAALDLPSARLRAAPGRRRIGDSARLGRGSGVLRLHRRQELRLAHRDRAGRRPRLPVVRLHFRPLAALRLGRGRAPPCRHLRGRQHRGKHLPGPQLLRGLQRPTRGREPGLPRAHRRRYQPRRPGSRAPAPRAHRLPRPHGAFRAALRALAGRDYGRIGGGRARTGGGCDVVLRRARTAVDLLRDRSPDRVDRAQREPLHLPARLPGRVRCGVGRRPLEDGRRRRRKVRNDRRRSLLLGRHPRSHAHERGDRPVL